MDAMKIDRATFDDDMTRREPGPGAAKRKFLGALAAGVAASLVPRAFAQSGYPNKTIKIIAPVQPGGGVDLVARTIADRLGRALGQSIIVENLSGGGGVVGSMAAARAAIDPRPTPPPPLGSRR